jgi:hypothetical protein
MQPASRPLRLQCCSSGRPVDPGADLLHQVLCAGTSAWVYMVHIGRCCVGCGLALSFNQTCTHAGECCTLCDGNDLHGWVSCWHDPPCSLLHAGNHHVQGSFFYGRAIWLSGLVQQQGNLLLSGLLCGKHHLVVVRALPACSGSALTLGCCATDWFALLLQFLLTWDGVVGRGIICCNKCPCANVLLSGRLHRCVHVWSAWYSMWLSGSCWPSAVHDPTVAVLLWMCTLRSTPLGGMCVLSVRHD